MTPTSVTSAVTNGGQEPMCLSSRACFFFRASQQQHPRWSSHWWFIAGEAEMSALQRILCTRSRRERGACFTSRGQGHTVYGRDDDDDDDEDTAVAE